MKEPMVITMAREYASGGSEIAQAVADKLGIPLYNKELITLAAKKSGLTEEAIAASENQRSGSLIYSLYMMGNTMPLADQVYILQSNVIKELAAEGHDDLVVLDADLAAATKTGMFRKAYPDRHFDCGIAEGNMMGVAAGLSTMGYVPFVSSFAMFAAGRAFEVQGVLDDWLHILRPRRRMQELVRKLKSRGYCVYYLSNIPEDVLDFLTERDLKGLFDGGVASCDVHINKPDPRIYKALLDKYQLKAGESVFIDDRLENVQAAFRLGFAGIQMKDSVGTLVRSLATCNVTLR